MSCQITTSWPHLICVLVFSQSKLLWIPYMSFIVLVIPPNLMPLKNLLRRTHSKVIRAKDGWGSAVMVIDSIKCWDEVNKQNEDQFLVFSKEEVTSNLRKLLSVWGCFLHVSLPDVLTSEETKATRKSSRRGGAIDGSWVREIDTFMMFLLNCAQEIFLWDHIVRIYSGGRKGQS